MPEKMSQEKVQQSGVVLRREPCCSSSPLVLFVVCLLSFPSPLLMNASLTLRRWMCCALSVPRLCAPRLRPPLTRPVRVADQVWSFSVTRAGYSSARALFLTAARVAHWRGAAPEQGDPQLAHSGPVLQPFEPHGPLRWHRRRAARAVRGCEIANLAFPGCFGFLGSPPSAMDLC
jgi:hypothetical protein